MIKIITIMAEQENQEIPTWDIPKRKSPMETEKQ